MSMFSLLTDAGVPLGPLTEPQTLWRATSVRAKLHRDPPCSRNAHHRTTVNLADVAADALCSRCAGQLPDPLDGYADEAAVLAQWKHQAEKYLTDGTLAEDR